MLNFENIFKDNVLVNDNYILIKDKTTSQEIKIHSSMIADLEINYNPNFSIIGNLGIYDQFQFDKILNTSNTIHLIIVQKDQYDKELKREFVVISKEKSKENNRIIYKFKFRDIISYTFSRLIKPKSYKNISLDKIIKEYYDEFVKTEIPIELDLDSVPEKENFIVTANMNFLDFIVGESKRLGFLLYQSKKKIYLKNFKELKISNLEEIPFEFIEKCSNDKYMFQIYEYNLLNPKNDLLKAATQVFTYDHRNKTIKIFKNTLKDSGFSNSKDSAQNYNGLIYTSKTDFTDDGELGKTYNSYVKTANLECIVPGNIEYTDKFKVFKLKLVGNSSQQETVLEGDKKLSGKYICVGFTDKLLFNMYYITKLNLVRFDEDSY